MDYAVFTGKRVMKNDKKTLFCAKGKQRVYAEVEEVGVRLLKRCVASSKLCKQDHVRTIASGFFNESFVREGSFGCVGDEPMSVACGCGCWFEITLCPSTHMRVIGPW